MKEVGGKPLLLQMVGEEVYCVSNKCPHLNLSMQGKTALLSATVSDGAHGPATGTCVPAC